jgi:drug/metabolite transporter (DMT)-like permease
MALVAFAGNSVLCRLALGSGAIDAASFTTVRLLSGALTLWLLLSLRRSAALPPARGSWVSAAMLFLYALCFSFAYVSLATGTGALILFGMVQLTMILAGVAGGERPHPLEWLGLFLALGGLIYLLLPGISAPSLEGAALMGLAGIAWGVYSLRGRGSRDPIAVTADNFARSVPMVAVVSLLALGALAITSRGLLLAIASGALASGVGYAIWYAALPGLTATRAATVQLCVPLVAALGGMVFAGESVTLRLAIAGLAILGGIAVATVGHARFARARRGARV